MQTVLDIDQRVTDLAARDARRADLDQRDKEHGGMRSIPEEIEREEKQRSMAGWGPYKPEITQAELDAARRGEPAKDPKRITVGRLALDVKRAVSRWAKLRSDTDKELVTTDALMLLLSWPEHGSDPSERYPLAERIDLGAAHTVRLAELRARREPNIGRSVVRYLSELDELNPWTLPLRRDWMDATRRDRDGYAMTTRAARRALHAAVKQAMRDRMWRAELQARELLTDVDIDALIDERAEDEGEPQRLPDGAAPEVIAELMSLPLDAGRAIVAQHDRLAHESGLLREQWGMAPGTYTTAISRGGAAVRARFPDSLDLLSAMQDLPRQYRELVERSATVALSDYRYGLRNPGELTASELREDEYRARRAVADWRGAIGAMSDQDRAILGAARRAVRRDGASYGSELAEHIAYWAPLLVDAEQRRKRYGLNRTGELAPTYPKPPPRRAKLAPELVARRAAQRIELDLLLEAGSSDAPRIAELRELDAGAPSWAPEPTTYGHELVELAPVPRWAKPDWTDESSGAAMALALLRWPSANNGAAADVLAWIDRAECAALDMACEAL